MARRWVMKWAGSTIRPIARISRKQPADSRGRRRSGACPGRGCAGLGKPLNTITTRDRLALVTVFIKGDPYVIVDIRLRMLTPRELARGQDFPEDYIIDRGHDGRKFSVATQVRMIGNSVNPVMAEAFLRANAPWLAVKKAA